MSSKLSHTGYLMIDHRESPGVPDEVLAAARKAGKNVLSAPKGTLLEMDVFRCNHCHAGIIRNPLRTRERAYCWKCDRYICDGCAAVQSQTGECVPFEKVLDELQEQAAKLLGR